MDFDSDGICILESITTAEECNAYIHFLGRESERHFIGQRDALKWAEWHSGAVVRREFHDAMAAFYRSAANRHQDDLDGITTRIGQIAAHRETLCE